MNETRKVYARQIPPEYQESPLYTFDEYPENVSVFGNRHYEGHKTNELEKVENALEECAEHALSAGRGQYYETFTAALEDYFPRPNGKHYDGIAKKAWRALLETVEKTGEDLQAYCIALELWTGTAYDYTTIRGTSQGDWQEIIYPADWTRDSLQAFETEYFNTGEEWLVHDGPETPETPEDISGYSLYVYRDARKEIAEVEDVNPENVTLYAFERYSQTPVYKLAE